MSQIFLLTGVVSDYDDTRYQCIFGRNEAAKGPTAYYEVRVPCSIYGILVQMHVKLETAPGVGKTYIYTVIRNGSSTPLSGVISDTDTEVTLRSMVLISPGDNLYIRVRPVNDPSQYNQHISLVFFTTDSEGAASASDSHWSGSTDKDNSGRYLSLGYNYQGDDEIERSVVAAEGKTISDLRVELEVAPGSGKSWTFTLRKNEVNTSLAVTISNTAKTGSDLANSVATSPGDGISIRAEPSGSPADTRIGFSMKLHGIANSHLIGGGDEFRVNTPGYSYPIGEGASTSDGSYQAMANAGMTITALFVKLDTAPGNGKSRTCTLVKKEIGGGATPTSVTVTIEDTDTEGDITGESVALSKGELFCLEWEEGDSPATAKASFGLLVEVSHTYPTITTDKMVSTLAYGTISAIGDGSTCSVRGFCYKEATEGDPNVFDDSYEVDGSLSTDGEFAAEEYSLELPLEAGKLYRVRAFAINDTGFAYGDTMAAYFAYPSDLVARVSSIRKVYHPGLYRMEIAVGDLGFNVDVSEAAIKRVPDEVAEPVTPSDEPVKPIVPGAPLAPLSPEKLQEWLDLQEKLGIWTSMEDWPSWATRTTAPELPPPTLKAVDITPKPSALPSVSNKALLDEFDKLMKLGPVRWTQADKSRLNVIVAELQSRGITGK
jgi:hypothetical protein